MVGWHWRWTGSDIHCKLRCLQVSPKAIATSECSIALMPPSNEHLRGGREPIVGTRKRKLSERIGSPVNLKKARMEKRDPDLPQSLSLRNKSLQNELRPLTPQSSLIYNILSTPGCPPFPPSEWLNIVHWKYVNLAKVLESVHTMELDPKQTHVIDDEVELALRVSKSSGGIKSSSDHNIVFTMYIEAIAFVFLQR